MSDKQQRKGKFYSFVTVGAITECGGRVTSGGGEAVIIDGAGYAAVMSDQPAALIGSRLSNGDKIMATPWEDQEYGIFVDEGKTIPGLFDPEWTPPPREPGARFAVSGATTARGGVLREVSSDWEIDGAHRKAGKIGDFVEYKDGTRARIVTGIGIPGDELNQYAVVGSRLDNGDVITDSPHRDSRSSTVFVPIDEHGVVIARQ
ncbi:hypothetical protein [Paraburkholderia sp. BL10I2N1]|uniref:hypothetical protein n=1 Tax=Paraburkholderia sp. BL10I2N1 TaxID=1938796 RepID=UPI0010DB7E8A|nr:hypothetical protein [Paraburkholderia sp. BL10I2N1]TDN63433.1 hypothetical protein B0G77_7085 [Paraburkholderia sp. BL10I2N1]